MIVLGNPEFAIGMKMAGIEKAYAIRSREEAISILKEVDKKEFILASVSIIELVPELEEFPNVSSVPDDARAFLSTDDLKGIVKSALGMELDI